MDIFELAGIREEDPLPDAKNMNLITRQKALNFAPGEQCLYNQHRVFLAGENRGTGYWFVVA